MKLLRLLATPFALLVVAFMRWRGNIRFGDFWSSRLGHLVGNTECYLGEKDAGMHEGFYDIWYSQWNRANRVIENKYRKQLHVWPGWFADLVMRCNRLFVGWEKHEVRPTQFDRDVHNLWEKHSPHIGFTEREERRGQKLLRQLGIPEGGKWVCLIVRDGAYLRAQSQGDFSYHDYRDSNISDYTPAVVELLGRGYWVIRMGAVVAKPMMVKHTRAIDYALSGQRTEFGDLYLGAKCEFCVATSTGFDAIPRAFGRPVVFVNHVPLEYCPSFYERALLIWKHHMRAGKRMTLAEIFDSGAGQFTFAPQFFQAGITLVDNTSQEIYEAVVEMCEWVECPFSTIKDITLPKEEKQRQAQFWSQFPLGAISPYNGKPLQGAAKMRIGREFLKQYSGSAEGS